MDLMALAGLLVITGRIDSDAGLDGSGCGF